MRRKSSLFTLPSLFLLSILFGGLGWTIWRGKGLVFSPGDLTAQEVPGIVLGGFRSHANFEKECHLCHQPLKTTQAQLCLDCHKAIRQELVDQRGLHSKMENIQRCFKCHSDHRGSSFHPGTAALAEFDHSITSFSLEWHQVNYDTTLMDCVSCHPQGRGDQFTPESCKSCHADHNLEFMTRHILDFGENCLDCHDGTDRMINFDHSTSAFRLTGVHLETPCASCHQGGKFSGTPGDCVQCHLEPRIHLRLFSQDCATCHNTGAWKPAFYQERPFDHERLSSFSLVRHAVNYAGQQIACTACHQEDLSRTDLQTCIACHRKNDQKFMRDHLDQFGEGCLECHDGVDRLSNFNHNTFFPLEGRHTEIKCQDCHVDKVYKGTPGECVLCHAEPEIHAGFFGVQCEYCHSAIAWTPAKLAKHEFPLDHGSQTTLACETCHPTVYAEYTCYGCHDHQPEGIREQHLELNISDQELANCIECHPAGVKEEDGHQGDG